MFPFAPGMLPWRVVYLIMSNVTLQFICSYNTFNCGMQFIKILHHKPADGSTCLQLSAQELLLTFLEFLYYIPTRATWKLINNNNKNPQYNPIRGNAYHIAGYFQKRKF